MNLSRRNSAIGSVLVDGAVFENRLQIGIWRVFYEVMIRTRHEIDYTLVLHGPARQPIPEGVATVRGPFRWGATKSKRWYRQMQRQAMGRKLQSQFPDAIWHSTFYHPDPRSRGRSVTTVYDMLSEHYSLWNPTFVDQSLLKCRALRAADSILCISSTVADELRRFYPDLTAPIGVARLGQEHLASPQLATAEDAPPYALFVGWRGYYKNFACLLEAAGRSDWPPKLKVRIVGPPLSDDERRLSHFHGCADRLEVLTDLDDHQLAQTYASAHCFIFPSLGEGFGLPTIEAQRNGCPVLASDLPIFREIAGEGALYFNPNEAATLVCQINQLDDPVTRQSLVNRGRINADRFTWDQTAEMVLATYQELLERSATPRRAAA